MSFYYVDISKNKIIEALISDEVDLSKNYGQETSKLIIDFMINSDIDQIIDYIDYIKQGNDILANDIPQFGHTETLIKVAKILAENHGDSLSNTQMGFFLKRDIHSSNGANAKYGETHSKGARMVGLATINRGAVSRSSLTKTFNDMSNDKKLLFVRKMYLRNKCIQYLLRKAKNEEVNILDSMKLLQESTKRRRSACIKYMLNELRNLNNDELNKRINNIKEI